MTVLYNGWEFQVLPPRQLQWNRPGEEPRAEDYLTFMPDCGEIVNLEPERDRLLIWTTNRKLALRGYGPADFTIDVLEYVVPPGEGFHL